MAIDGAVPQTPVKARDKHWATSEGRADWLEPHPAIEASLTASPVVRETATARGLPVSSRYHLRQSTAESQAVFPRGA